MNIFLKHAEQIARQARAERVLRALAQYTFDGTEVHWVVDRELPGLENAIVASSIRHAIQAQYRDTVPIDAVVEIVGLFDQGEHE